MEWNDGGKNSNPNRIFLLVKTIAITVEHWKWVMVDDYVVYLCILLATFNARKKKQKKNTVARTHRKYLQK